MDATLAAGSWGSVKGGKWHRTVSERPSWTKDETSLCGLTFRPLNVTWGEEPPTGATGKCIHCLEAPRTA